MKDAYKNIPAKIDELCLQGFIWLGKFFIELKQTFGALTSVSNFNILGNTVQTLARAVGKLPKNGARGNLTTILLWLRQKLVGAKATRANTKAFAKKDQHQTGC
jgi:hypothetical protein